MQSCIFRDFKIVFSKKDGVGSFESAVKVMRDRLNVQKEYRKFP